MVFEDYCTMLINSELASPLVVLLTLELCRSCSSSVVLIGFIFQVCYHHEQFRNLGRRNQTSCCINRLLLILVLFSASNKLKQSDATLS